MSVSLGSSARDIGRVATHRHGAEICIQPRHRLRDRQVTAMEASGARPVSRNRPQPAWTLRHHARETAALVQAIAAARQSATIPVPDISIRVSDGLTCSGALADTLAGILAETQLAAEHLHLEFSEAALQAEEPDLVFALAALRDLGVLPILGGFGGGVSSLSLLRRRSLGGLLGAVKLDASLLRDFDSNETDLDFLHGLVGTSHALDLLVIAEGVDNDRQFRMLAAAGCDEATGAWFGASEGATDLPAGW